MKLLRLLIIEDEEAIIKQYKDDLELFNEDKANHTKITAFCVNNPTEGIKALKENYYDAVIVDLRLTPNDEGKGGREMIDIIRKGLRFPIFIVSNLQNEAFLDESFILKKRTKGEFYNEELYKEIIQLCDTLDQIGISDILGGKGIIEQHLSYVFWNHISNSIPYWIEKKDQGMDTETALLRYTLTHLQEYLEINEGEFDDYHPIEFYINPPIKQHPNTVFTADIFQEKETNKCYIVLTPSCDLVERIKGKGGSKTVIPPKATHITFAEIEDLEEKIKNQNNFRDSLNNNQLYHYVPPFIFGQGRIINAQGGVINFSKVKSIPLGDVIDETKYQKILAVSNSFAKDIIARFSLYYARQGQPGLKQEIVVAKKK